MFDPTSRYAKKELATCTLADGSVVRYVRRRFCPAGEELPLLVEVTVQDGDRLDLMTHRTLGDALQFWRVCDANDAMNPCELLAPERIGSPLRVPIPTIEP
jgi:hypothetical protein